jgi:hypothetical protein
MCFLFHSNQRILLQARSREGMLSLSSNIGKILHVLFMNFKYLLIDFIYLFFIIHLFTCAYIVWVISSPCLPPPTSPLLPPSLPGRTCSAFISNFVEEKT